MIISVYLVLSWVVWYLCCVGVLGFADGDLDGLVVCFGVEYCVA